MGLIERIRCHFSPSRRARWAAVLEMEARLNKREAWLDAWERRIERREAQLQGAVDAVARSAIDGLMQDEREERRH